ncbi:MAG: hypothetical protein LUE27_11035 [Clostridia bacterium]|nr:hypothetical protein [Clostridia bacterium]
MRIERRFTQFTDRELVCLYYGLTNSPGTEEKLIYKIADEVIAELEKRKVKGYAISSVTLESEKKSAWTLMHRGSK